MQIDKNDPRLTAYALGELPQDEIEQINKLIEGDNELQQEVEEIRAFAGALRESLAQEPVDVTDTESQKVVAPAKKRSRVGRIIMYTSAIAAVFVFAVGIIRFGEQSNSSFEAIIEDVSDAEGGGASPEPKAQRDLGAGVGHAEAIPEGTVLTSDDFVRTPTVKSLSAGRETAREYKRTTTDKSITLPTSEVLDGMPSRIISRKISDKTAKKGEAISTDEKKSREEIIAELVRENQTKNLEDIQSRSSTEVQPNNPIRYPKDWSKLVKRRNISSQSGAKKAKDNWALDVKEAYLLPRETIVYPLDWERIKAKAALQKAEGKFNTETYDQIVENGFERVSEHPLSTFSIDVDTASYSNVRRMLNNGKLPPAGAVRIEEMVNYFDYDYRTPSDDKPFATHMQAVQCPWNEKHNLLRVGLKGKMVAADERPQGNFVFLLDVSGSMSQPNKLPLVVEGMKLLVNQLNEKDRVAIVVYAGASGLVLPSTSCADKHKIIEALDRLNAGGSTNGGQGITLAYATAAANFVKGGINRVILCTDGDFNIGMTNQSDLVRLIEKKAKENVFLTVLGFGMGNYKDSNLEKLADKGNGNYGYIDTLSEAKKMLVEQLSGTLLTIAKDVKIQIEFNPAAVKAYRLIGYENRKLNKEDFNDDKKDAGEIGAGHTVTALYELIPAGTEETLDKPKVDTLKYQKTAPVAEETAEMLTLKLRYKEPDEDTSKLISFPLKNSVVNWSEADMNTRFASSVAAFGMLLRKSKYSGNADYVKVIDWAGSAKGKDHFGYRQEFIGLVRAARSLSNR